MYSPLPSLIVLQLLSLYTFRSIAFVGNFSDIFVEFSSSGARPTSITSAPPPISSSTSSCAQCLIWASNVQLEQMYWVNTSLGVTLDTISVIVTQYNHTAITNTKTVHGDIKTVNTSTITIPAAMTSLMPVPDTYNLVTILNGSDGDALVNIPYPTPYLAIGAFYFFSMIPARSACSRTAPCNGTNGSTYSCVSRSVIDVIAEARSVSNIATSSIVLPSTYYQALKASSWSQYASLNIASFTDFLKAAGVYESVPALSSCSVEPDAIGPPAYKIPVSALTGTVSTTIAGVGNPGAPTPTPTAQPGSSISLPLASLTKETPAALSRQTLYGVNPYPNGVEPTVGSLESETALANPSPSLAPGPLAIPPKEPPVLPQTTGPNGEAATPQHSMLANPSNPPQPATKATPEHAPAQAPAPAPKDQNAPVFQAGTALPPAIVYAGSTHQPDTSSAYHLPSVGPIIAGGSPVTTNNIIYSLAPSANTLISNGHSIPLNTIAASPLNNHASTRALDFASSTYAANPLSQYIIASQTLTPGGAITVSGTPISLAPSGNVAVVGSKTQSLAVAGAIPSSPAVITFGGTTYTLNSSSSAFVISGQTLPPGGAITVQNTPISFPNAGTAVVIGGSSTQPLITPAPVAPENVFSLGGSTYTLDANSDFVVAGQTLSEGGVITVSGTAVSFAASGGDVVVGTSTEGSGGVILNELGSGTGTNQTGAVAFEGGAKDGGEGRGLWRVGVVVGAVGLWMMA